ncbi:hypothetical protein [Nocardia fluminea]|uniref:hypothetical protein n=1 Tax=Nocardia fluminea TaxID=134984 RepID=UPI003404D10C
MTEINRPENLFEGFDPNQGTAARSGDSVTCPCSSPPRLLAGTPDEVVNLTGTFDNDLDYYAVELVRLQDAAREMLKVFGSPHEVDDALASFDAALPNLRAVRNPLAHPSDDARLDGVVWFSNLVRLRDDGAVENLLDPRYQHHEAAIALADALIAYLRNGIRASLA